MSFEELVTTRPLQKPQDWRKLLKQKRNKTRRYLKRSRNQFLATLHRQYYLTDAWADARQALRRNEDIALASVIIIAVLSFGAISGITNAIYTFMLAASIMSTVSGISLALLAVAAFGVLFTIGSWAQGLQMNLLSLSLADGLNRKQNCSLRSTWRRSLHKAARSASSMWLVTLLALAPAAIVAIATVLILVALHMKLPGALPYLVGAGLVCLGWIGLILCNFSLVPYVALFEKTGSWQDTFRRAQYLVSRKGRMFILGGYLLIAASLGVSYGLAVLLQHLTGMSATLVFLTLACAVVTVWNALLTMLYRKRKLARKYGPSLRAAS